MSKKKYLIRGVEFACVTAITYVLAQADVNDVWLSVPTSCLCGNDYLGISFGVNGTTIKSKRPIKIAHEVFAF